VFNPKTIGKMKVIAEVASIEYYKQAAIIEIHEGNVIKAMQLLALAEAYNA